jgi:hypothetical protein
MKTFKDLKVTDVLYIIRDDGYAVVCRVVKIADFYNRTIVYYDYADKYTENDTTMYFYINMEMCGEHSCLVCEKSGYTVYLNRELALKDLDERIEFLTRQKKNL